jgi:DNA-binding response OmpR family regulator
MSVPRLLVIDQDPSVQHAVETALSHGFEVTTVGDGLSALDVASPRLPTSSLPTSAWTGSISSGFEKLKQKNVLKTVALLLLVSPTEVYDELTLRLVGVSVSSGSPSTQELLDRVKRYVPTPAVVPRQRRRSRAPRATR